MTRSGLRKVILVGGACEHFPVELSVLPAKLCDYPNRGYWIDRLVPARHLIVFGVPTPAVHVQTAYQSTLQLHAGPRTSWNDLVPKPIRCFNVLYVRLSGLSSGCASSESTQSAVCCREFEALQGISGVALTKEGSSSSVTRLLTMH